MIRKGKISKFKVFESEKDKLVRDEIARDMMSKPELRWILRSELMKKLGPVTKTPNPMFNPEKYRRSLTDPNFDFRVNETCCLCGKNITDFKDSHNPFPLNQRNHQFPLTVEKTDRCCTRCDWAVVIPQRIYAMSLKKNK